jgi:DNA repair exonuclease SbcCD nuclease subunit
MRALITGDIHLTGNLNDNIVENLPERLYQKKNILYSMGIYCRENGIKIIIIAGDVLHNKNIIYSIALDVLLSFIRDFSDLQIICIDGNHDLSSKSSENVVSALRCLDTEKNVIRVPFDSQLQIENVLFMPYSTKVAEKVKSNSADYLISHFGLSESILSSGISLVSDIKLSDLIGKYKKVIISHYHLPQEIIRPDIEVYIPGSIVQDTWNECGEEKRFLIVDTEKYTIKSKLIEGYTKHFEFSMTNANRTEVIEECRKLQKEGHLIKIKKTENIDTKDIENDFIIIDKTDHDITNRGINSSMTMSDKLEKYMGIKEIPKELQEKYKKVGMDIINAC